MNGPFTIGQLAKTAGVPASTVRYYERQGLLSPNGRSDGNYRVYDGASLRRLRFIRTAQFTGFRLRDIQQLLEMRDGSTGSCCDVKQIIEQRLGGVDETLEELQRIRRVLAEALEWCRQGEPDGRCQVLDELDQEPDE